MNKVLIWDIRIPLKDSGGPSGYLYQIKQYLESNSENFHITFLSKFSSPTISLSNKHPKINKLSSKGVLSYMRRLYSIYRLTHNPFLEDAISKCDINSFTHIHFHSSLDLYNAIGLLKDFKGKIVLTSHSPEPISCEIVTTIFGENESLGSSWARNHLMKAEAKAFAYASLILFPTEYSVEPYMQDNAIASVLKSDKAKLIYCPTSILDKNTDKEYVNSLREQLSIPSDAFVISYVGRHNRIKGYDILKDIATVLLDKYSDVYFIIAGRQGPLYGLQHERWIELGWTDKANEIISASDLFILPNRATYFDLVALEVLRAGTPILMTLTGGNKYFNEIEKNNQGLFFFNPENVPGAIAEIDEVYSYLGTSKLDELRDSNRMLWLDRFTMAEFIKRYLSCLS